MNKIEEFLGEKKYAELLTRSTVIGKSRRLSEALSQKEINFAFLGGSVTCGYMSEVSYPDLLLKRLSERFPEKNLSYVNYGMSGTAGLMGLVLTEDMLTKNLPDIVMFEYAVNEEPTSRGAQVLEGLIRKLLALPSRPAVVPVCIFNEAGCSCEEIILHISKHYGLSSAALFTGVYPMFPKNELPWELYSDDYCHPSKNGHALITDVIMKVLDNAQGEANSEMPPPIISDCYASLRLVDLIGGMGIETDMPLYDSSCFMLFGGRENVPECSHRLTLRLFCRKLVFITMQCNDPAFGDIAISIDGVEATRIQGYSIFAWGNPLTTLVLDSQAPAEHLVEIELDKENANKRFTILRIASA